MPERRCKVSDIQLLRDLADTLEQERAEVQAFVKSVEATNKHLDKANERIAKLQAVVDAAERVIDSWFNGNVDGDLDGNMHDMAEALAELETDDE